MKYKIYKGSNGKYIFSFNKWGFFNIGWTGLSQPYVHDPNYLGVIQFDSEEDARIKAEEITKENLNKWEEIK